MKSIIANIAIVTVQCNVILDIANNTIHCSKLPYNTIPDCTLYTVRYV